MIAALFDGPGRPFRFEESATPRPGPGEALVRVTLCTVCGSDLHTHSGRRPGPTPCVLGHEVVGVVEAAGAGSPARAGSRVVLGVAASCGACFYCERGLPQKCEGLRKLGHERHGGGGAFGGLASHLLVPAGVPMLPVPAGVPDEAAAPAGCATATAAAVLGRASLGPGGCVVVFGAGMLGLAAAALSRAAGAESVIVCDPDPGRRALALEFGTTSCAGGFDESGSIVRDQTAGRGADAALELSGAPGAAACCIDVLRIGGVAVWAGTVSPCPPVAVDPEKVVRRCLTVAGVHNYAPADLTTAVDFLAGPGKKYPFARLVERTYALADVEEAFRDAALRRPVRVGVRP